jgi:hypothetical protein
MYTIKTNKSWFDFSSVGSNSIDIYDVANSLSKVNRFTGHTNIPYNVAQHSIFVAYLIKKDGHSARLRLLGLMHDFHEAYFSDMSSPLKSYLRDHLGFDANKYCDAIDDHIFSSFGIGGISAEEHAIIKKYDYMAYEYERIALFDREDTVEINVDGHSIPLVYIDTSKNDAIVSEFNQVHHYFFKMGFEFCRDSLIAEFNNLMELNGL